MKNKIKILSLLSVILLFSLTLVPITIGRSIVTNEQCDNNIETQTPSNYYAVIAGCSKYKDPSSNLPIAEWKLKSFYNALLSAPNWNKENIILLIGDSDDYPKNQNMFNGGATRENILAALDEMSGRVGSNDIFVFSWQGHGSEIPDEDGDEGFLDRYDEVICPYDCTRIYTSELINYISDDELDSKFDKIQAKGMLLMFESCLSSGLVDDIILSELAGTDGIIDENEAEYINNEFKEDFEQQGQSDDVNGPNRIVLTSTFGGFIKETLGLASWIYGFAMTATMAQAIKKYSAGIGPADDKNKDGYISAEEAIKWLKPKMLVRNSMLWGFIWSIFFTEELYISELMGDPDPIGAAINATKMFIFEFCYCQFIFRVSTGHFALNWPTSLDQFSGELQLVKTSQSNSEDDEVEIPALPNMLWEKPEYSQLTEDFRQIISKEKY